MTPEETSTIVAAFTALTKRVHSLEVREEALVSTTKKLWMPGELSQPVQGSVASLQGVANFYSAVPMIHLTPIPASLFSTLMPENVVTGPTSVDLIWANLGAGVGGVHLIVASRYTEAGANFNTGTGGISNTNNVTASAQDIHVVTTHVGASAPAGSLLSMTVTRRTDNAFDTLPNSIGLLGIMLGYSVME